MLNNGRACGDCSCGQCCVVPIGGFMNLEGNRAVEGDTISSGCLQSMSPLPPHTILIDGSSHAKPISETTHNTEPRLGHAPNRPRPPIPIGRATPPTTPERWRGYPEPDPNSQSGTEAQINWTFVMSYWSWQLFLASPHIWRFGCVWPFCRLRQRERTVDDRRSRRKSFATRIDRCDRARDRVLTFWQSYMPLIRIWILVRAVVVAFWYSILFFFLVFPVFLFCSFVGEMLLGAMPDESAAGLLVPTAKSRATDFSIAAIMARGSPEPCLRHPSEEQQEGNNYFFSKHISL